MAPFLRASIHGLRSSRRAPSPSLSAQRELLKQPESSDVLRRWYGGNAALEETCSSSQTANETVGESRAGIQGDDSSKVVDKQGSKVVDTTNAFEKKHSTNELSSTLHPDKLASLIIGKMRSKNNLNSPKDNSVPLQTNSTSSSMTNKLPEGSSQPIQGDRWKQIMNTMRNAAPKTRENPLSGVSISNRAKTAAGENQDDFADLDLPPARGAVVESKVPINFQSAIDAFKNLTVSAKSKEGGLQKGGLPGPQVKQKGFGFQGMQQKLEEKPVSFSFLKSLDATATTSGVAQEENTNANSSKIPASNQRSPSSNLQDFGLDSSKAFAKAEPSHEARSASSYESKGAHESMKRTTHSGHTVCIRNLPSHSNLALAKEALSLHGEIVSSFKKQNSDGSCHAFIEFKTAEAMDGALASRWVNIDSKAFSIVRADVPFTTVVRLNKVKAETTEIQLFSLCEKFGSLDIIKKRGNGVYDVYYKANELPNMSTILDSLNEVTLNQRRLLAIPAPLLHPAMRKEMLKGSEGQAWHASQLSQTLQRIEGGLDCVSVCLEDLKSLTAMEDELASLGHLR